jgi:hypothetical protein
MAQFGVLHEERWQDQGSTFRKTRAWEFHQRLAEAWIPSGRAVLTLLTVGGRVIAGCYGFLEGDRFYHYQIGWDRQYADLSLGNLAVKQCVLFCLERGVKVVDRCGRVCLEQSGGSVFCGVTVAEADDPAVCRDQRGWGCGGKIDGSGGGRLDGGRLGGLNLGPWQKLQF